MVTPGGDRRWSRSRLMAMRAPEDGGRLAQPRRTVTYARVSTAEQKDTRVCPQIIRFSSSDQTRRFRRFVTSHPDSVHYPIVDTILCAPTSAERPARTVTCFCTFMYLQIKYF